MPRFSVLCDSSRAAGGQYGWVSSTGFADADRLRNKRPHSHALPTRSSAPRSSRPSRTARSFQSMRGIRYRINSTRSHSFPGLPRQLRAATCLSWQLPPSRSRNVNDPNRIRCRQVVSRKRLATETADTTEPGWNGYLLTVACPCGIDFERWVTPEEAELDLLRAVELN